MINGKRKHGTDDGRRYCGKLINRYGCVAQYCKRDTIDASRTHDNKVKLYPSCDKLPTCAPRRVTPCKSVTQYKIDLRRQYKADRVGENNVRVVPKESKK
jgi:hypothetical protein